MHVICICWLAQAFSVESRTDVLTVTLRWAEEPWESESMLEQRSAAEAPARYRSRRISGQLGASRTPQLK